MRQGLKFTIASLVATAVLAGVSFTMVAPSGAAELSGSSHHVASISHAITVADLYHAPTKSVCSTNVPVGVAHCNADVQVNSVDPHEQFMASAKAALTLGDNGAYSPAYLQSAYDVSNPLNEETPGSGQVIGIVGAFNDPTLVSDVAYYRQYFGLPACPAGTVSAANTSCVIDVVNQNGGTELSTTNNDSWAMEASIDIDMVSAICPNCQILFVEATNATLVDLGASVNTAISLGASVVSNSYGSAEFPGQIAIAKRDFSHKGVPVVVAAGEGDPAVEFPASAPDVVAVGGTTLVQNSDNGVRDGYETAWGNTASGCSQYEPKPAWQHDKGCARRTVADVAAVADPDTGVWIYDSDSASGSMIAGGTSVATPIIASLFALAANTHTANAYPVSYLYQHRNALYNVTSGSSQGCSSYLCNAAYDQVGYNGLTGLGTPGATPNSFGAFTAQDPPTAPNIRSAVANDGSVTLTWNPSNANGEADSLGYQVYDGTSKDSVSELVNSQLLGSTTLVVSGLQDATTYYFDVRALTYGGASKLSNSLAATPYAANDEPGSPTAVIVDAVSGLITVSWSAPSNPGGSSIIDYAVTDNSGDVCIVSASAVDPMTCTFALAATSSGITFYVVAANQEGSGPPSAYSDTATTSTSAT